MNAKKVARNLAVIVSLAVWLGGTLLGTAQGSREAVESLRGDLKASRTAMIAEEMQLTEKESDAFWPIYRKYRADVDKVTDRIVKLIFEYADLYPEVPDRKAGEMLREYSKVETELLSIKRKYYKKLGKVLPAAKVFRFAQLDNRYDLGTRVALAAWIPMLPAEQAAPKDAQ